MGILRRTLLAALLCGGLAAAFAADAQEQPGAELLEFLGTWEGDEEWELFVDFASDNVEEADDAGNDVDVERSANRDVGPDYE